MRQFLSYVPLFAGSLVVGSVVIGAGGSVLQSAIAGVTTGATGFATAALVSQSHGKQQRQIYLNRAHPTAAEPTHHLHDLLQQNITALGEHKADLSERLDSLQQQLPNLHDAHVTLAAIKAMLERVETAMRIKDGYANVRPTDSRLMDSRVGEAKMTGLADSDHEAKEEGAAINPVRINDPRAVIEFLDNRGIKVKTVPPEDPADEIINSLSRFLGTNYEGLRELLARIKRNMQQGAPFWLSLKEYTQRDVSNVCQFCSRLHAIAFLEKYDYFKAPQYLVKAKTTTLPAAQNFFSGKWLERFVLLTVQKCVTLIAAELEQDIEFSYLLNPQINLPNGDDFELDLICHINGFFFWIEAKSGDYQQHISKYSKISKIFDLDVRHSIMVLPDISEDRCDALTALFAMTVASLSRLEAVLMATIRQDQTGNASKPEVEGSHAAAPTEATDEA